MQSSAMELPTETDMGLAAHVTAGKKFIVITGASGAGKTTVEKALLKRDSNLRLQVSVTTRDPRDSDLPGEYCYVSAEAFQELEDRGKFEWQVPNGRNGNRYGTLKQSVADAKQAEFPTVFHVEPDTIPLLLKVVDIEAVYLIFLVAGSDQVKGRLRDRDSGKPEEHFQDREATLAWEDDARKSGLPYHFVVNSNGKLEEAVTEVVQIITAP